MMSSTPSSGLEILIAQHFPLQLCIVLKKIPKKYMFGWLPAVKNAF
jgi:hypothetical protein